MYKTRLDIENYHYERNQSLKDGSYTLQPFGSNTGPGLSPISSEPYVLKPNGIVSGLPSQVRPHIAGSANRYGNSRESFVNMKVPPSCQRQSGSNQLRDDSGNQAFGTGRGSATENYCGFTEGGSSTPVGSRADQDSTGFQNDYGYSRFSYKPEKHREIPSQREEDEFTGVL